MAGWISVSLQMQRIVAAELKAVSRQTVSSFQGRTALSVLQDWHVTIESGVEAE